MPRLSVGILGGSVSYSEAGSEGRGDLAGGEVGEWERAAVRARGSRWCQKGQRPASHPARQNTEANPHGMSMCMSCCYEL